MAENTSRTAELSHAHARTHLILSTQFAQLGWIEAAAATLVNRDTQPVTGSRCSICGGYFTNEGKKFGYSFVLENIPTV